MRVAELLASSDRKVLEDLGKELLRTEEPMSVHSLCSNLESVLRSFAFVQSFLLTRQPPTFSILTCLIEAAGFGVEAGRFQELVKMDVERLCTLIDGREILRRDDQLKLYRQVLYEARLSDLEIDPSEASLLGALRRVLGISQVEHFLLEHHADFREFWLDPDCYSHEMKALKAAGLVYERHGEVLLPEDLAGVVGQALGIDLPSSSARRLYAMLSNEELLAALETIGLRTSGLKEERVERLLTSRTPARSVLAGPSIGSLRAICRDVNAPVSGSKEELIERIVAFYGAGLDAAPVEPAEVARPKEERVLPEPRFRLLFQALRGHELTAILREFPFLRQSGTKEVRSATLWEAAISEENLLSELRNRELERILERLELGIAGSKRERIQRLILRFAVGNVEALQRSSDASDEQDRAGS